MAGFQLTYSTMFAALPELHVLFDRALLRVAEPQGREHALALSRLYVDESVADALITAAAAAVF